MVIVMTVVESFVAKELGCNGVSVVVAVPVCEVVVCVSVFVWTVPVPVPVLEGLKDSR